MSKHLSERGKSERIATSGGSALGHNPFGALNSVGVPSAEPKAEVVDSAPKNGVCAPATTSKQGLRSRGRLELRRVKAGRGGKTVTLVSGFIGIGTSEKDALCKTLRQACGCGGTVNTSGEIEIQGDQRERIAALLREKDFQPVFAGG